MRRLFLQLMLVLLGLSIGVTGAWAPHAAVPAGTDHTSPAYDLKAQSLVDLQLVERKFVDLANALPTDKLTWRPSPESRSFAEVFLHVAGERYQILALMGRAPQRHSMARDSKNRQPTKHGLLMS
jgi:hypothetical protein